MKLASLFLVAFLVSASTAEQALSKEVEPISNLIYGFFDGLTTPGTPSVSRCTSVYANTGEAYTSMIDSFKNTLQEPASFFAGITALRIMINELNQLLNTCNIPALTDTLLQLANLDNLGVYAVKYFTEFTKYENLRKQAMENFQDENYQDAGNFFAQIFAGVTNFYLN